MSLFGELRRRNVLRVGAAYIVSSWLLIQVAETIFPLFGFGDAPARIVVIVLAIGFVPALVVSWAFELTPEGFRRESPAGAVESTSPGAGKKLDRLIMVVLALALGYFAIDKFVFEPARDAARESEIAEKARTEALIGSYGQNSLAVLPFVNMSDDVANEYFSDGIAEEVLNLLAKVPNLRVISRSSSFSFRGKDIDIPTIAERLDVALVLEGSVRKYGNQVRITAQLIEARSDTHLWSETYERELEDVFAIQDDISTAIVDSLRETIKLDIGEAPRTTAATNTEAHEAYLRGRYLLAQRGASVAGAVREFEKAISLDPDYALAHAQLAIAYQLGYLDLTYAEATAKAAPHVEKAMALDPSLAEAHAAAGQLSWKPGSMQEALDHFEKAVEINPNYADAYTWMANILDWWLGRYAEAFALREKVVQLDPLSLPGMSNYAIALIVRDRLSEADREMEKLASILPAAAANLGGWRLSAGGNWADGALATLEALRANPGRLDFLAFWLALLGLEAEASALADFADPQTLAMLGKHRQAVKAAQVALEADPADQRNRDALGLALAGAGDYDLARPHLEESWQVYDGRIVAPPFGVDYAVALIAARRAAGEGHAVADLVAAIRNNVRRYREAGISTLILYASPEYEDGLAHFLSGDEQRGLELIAQAVDNGYFVLPDVAYLQFLYQHPGFARIRDLQEAGQAREREKFLAVVCSDNPYADIWQPSGETCEGVGSE